MWRFDRIAHHILLVLFLNISFSSVAQTNLTEENADCYGAVEIRDSIFGPVFPGRGFGHIAEITASEDSQSSIDEEHHSIWYGFRVPWDCEFSFDIIPQDESDDIDFMLFPDSTPQTCIDLYSGFLHPIRSNISRNRKDLNSRTGLAMNATKEFVGSGPSEHAYSRSVIAKKGDRFLLLVDQKVEPKAPYTIHMHYGKPPVDTEVADEGKTQHMVISIKDSETGESIPAMVTVDGVSGRSSLRSVGADQLSVNIQPYRTLLIEVEKEGYLPSRQRTRASADTLVYETVLLTPLRPGVKITWKDINFVGNKAEILRSSKRALEELEQVMLDNPDLRIEIQGHVNGPSMQNTKALRELSESRAKAVYMHLRKTGIHPDRMEYVGLGNSQMKFPDARTNREQIANRRVEIRILDNAAFERTADTHPLSP